MSRSFLATVAVAMLSLSAQAQNCQQIAGNYYCGQTDAVAFNNVGFTGTYNQITGMDSSSCTCSSQPKGFSGPIAPLNDEVFDIALISANRSFRCIFEVLFRSLKSPFTTEAPLQW